MLPMEAVTESSSTPTQSGSLWKQAKRRFVKNRLALAGLIYLCLCVFVALFAFLFMPDDTHNANFQLREVSASPPGTRVTVLLRPSGQKPASPGWIGYLFSGRPDAHVPLCLHDEKSWRIHADSLSFTRHNGLQSVELLPVFLLRPDVTHSQSLQWKNESGKPYLLRGDQLTWMNASGVKCDTSLSALVTSFETQYVMHHTFRFGSDTSGRDVLSRLILGARVSLAVGLMSVLVSMLIGITLGSIAGLFRGRVDLIVMWFVSVVWSIPTLLLAIAISFALGQGFWQLFIAIGVSMWVDVARMVRGQIFILREMQYVEAARVLGYKPTRIILKHILPNALGPVLIVAAANFSTAILLEAGLSFLGVGVKPPTPSWGGMIFEGYNQIMFDSGKWLALFPGLAMVLLVISVNLVGFGLRDALDPRHQASI
jgi:peptide/nickel transport system permease protein